MGWKWVRSCSLNISRMTYFDVHTHHLPTICSNQTIVSFSIPYENIDKNATRISVGIHPWHLTEDNAETSLQALRMTLADKRVVAIGEAGLDRTHGCSLSTQTTIFRQEIALSEESHLPMSIHCVHAFNELLQLKKEIHPSQSWIIHGFRGKPNMAKELIRHGCYISIGSKFQNESLHVIPLERMFIETDEAPENITGIYRHIAETKGISVEELVEAINKNVQEVFFKR